jgi:hypothetical protein
LPSRRKIPATLQQQVRQRANNLCEYCHASEQWQYVRFTVDHVIPLTLGGNQTFENLALACFHCNRRKTNSLTAIDPHSREQVPLFNPRQHNWNDHFIWSADGLYIVGLTATGRATIVALALNRERVVGIRAADHVAGRHPPPTDSIQREQ